MKLRQLLLSLFCYALIAITFASPNDLSIQIEGVEGDALKNVEARLTILKNSLNGKYTKENIEHFMRITPREIKKGIAPFGYFYPNIDVSSSKSSTGWVINCSIQPGRVTTFRKIDIKVLGSGANDPVFQKYLKTIPIKVGAPLNTQDYENIKSNLFAIAITNGYFDATTTESKLIVDLRSYHADVVIHFETGDRYAFGKTTFSKSPLKESLLKRFLPYKVGDPYKNAKIQELQQDLNNSAYFQGINIRSYPHQSEDYYVPIYVNLESGSSRVYNIGVGGGTDTGPRASLGVDFRRLNSSGHKFNLTGVASTRRSGVVGTYSIPGKHPATDQYFISGGTSRESSTQGNSTAAKISTGYSFAWKGWQPTISLTYLTERYNIANKPKTNTYMAIPGFQISRVSRDHPISPNNGYRINFHLLGARQELLSKSSFIQTTAGFRFLKTFFNDYRFLTRLDTGYTAISSLDDLPFSLQLYAGGAQSVRGYSYNSLGPGRNLLTGSVELQRRIYKSFYLVGFLDAGNVSDKWLPVPLKKGIGSGVAWISPVGMIELTIAQAVDNPNKPWRIQFSVGSPI